jgi:hypothetical protein
VWELVVVVSPRMSNAFAPTTVPVEVRRQVFQQRDEFLAL